MRLALGIAPFSGVLGFVTPLLVDRWSGGDPGRAGKAYAVNILGCILGPLLSGFLLLPLISERWVLFVFSLPWLLIGVRPNWFSEGTRLRFDWQAGVSYAVVLAALALVFTQTKLTKISSAQQLRVLRDNTATIVATGEGTEQTAAGQRRRNYRTHSDHQVHGAPAAGVSGSSAEERFGGVLRHGHNLPLAAVLGHSGDRGGVGA